MKTHLYTLCWNEADMLEFFFRNYDSWVDRYFIYDDGSTDGSIEILKAHPKVELRQWNRKFQDTYVMSQLHWMNEVWKESRGEADWVVLVDIDEHLCSFKNPMLDLLKNYQSQKTTIIPALGFQMLSEDFPKEDEHLVKTRTLGAPYRWMCKLSILQPDAIEETNFSSGRHTANPGGQIKLPPGDELLLFHYKYLGFDRTFKKESAQSQNLGEFDRVTGLKQYYGCTLEKMRSKWDYYLKDAKDISWPQYKLYRYPFYFRWWRLSKYYFVSKWFRRGMRFVREPSYMIKRLKQFIEKSEHQEKKHHHGMFMEELYCSPLKKKIYLSTIDGIANGEEGNTIVVSNGKDKKGSLYQCLYTPDFDTLQNHRAIENTVEVKTQIEKKYNMEFDAFVVTNSKGFKRSAKKVAKTNKIKLVSHYDLMSFLQQAEIPESEEHILQ